MVVALGPGKFYGSSLPRPRIYTDVKLNPDRVDPPVPVMDPLLSWAHEAHWSMGGLSFKRLRLQGRIEGNVNKLRKIREKQAKFEVKSSPKEPRNPGPIEDKTKYDTNKERVRSVLPPPAPKAGKRRRYIDLFDEESEGEEEEEEEQQEEVVEKVVKAVKGGGKKRLVRKLVGDFDRVAKESELNKSSKVGDLMGLKTRRKWLEETGDVVMKVIEEVNRENSDQAKRLKSGKKGKNAGGASGSGGVSRIRTSPRLAKRRSS